jgi:hypothetical protein
MRMNYALNTHKVWIKQDPNNPKPLELIPANERYAAVMNYQDIISTFRPNECVAYIYLEQWQPTDEQSMWVTTRNYNGTATREIPMVYYGQEKGTGKHWWRTAITYGNDTIHSGAVLDFYYDVYTSMMVHRMRIPNNITLGITLLPDTSYNSNIGRTYFFVKKSGDNYNIHQGNFNDAPVIENDPSDLRK